MSGTTWVKRDEETGRLQKKYSDDAFLRAVAAREYGAQTQEVADDVGCHLNTARKRLRSLSESGEVVLLNMGGTIVSHLTEEGKRALEEQ